MPPEVAAPGLSPQVHSVTEPPLKCDFVPPHMNRQNLSVTDVSDMLINLYKTNVANAPKNQQATVSKYKQTSPTSAEGNKPSSIAAIATIGAAAAVNEPKNLQNDEMMNSTNEQQQQNQAAVADNMIPSGHSAIADQASFRQSTENAHIMADVQNSNANNNLYGLAAGAMPTMNAIPTSVVVTPNGEPLDIKPVIHPTTGQVIQMMPHAGLGVGSSVIKSVGSLTDATIPSLAPLSSALERANVINNQQNNSPVGVLAGGCEVLPPAAVLAAALLRDGYHNFQQQLRNQELLQANGQSDANNGNVGENSTANTLSSKILENFIRQRRMKSEGATDNNVNESDDMDGDDEDDSHYNGFDDIHLVEGTKTNYNNMGGLFHPGATTSSSSHLTGSNADYMSDDSQKYMFATQAYRHLEYSLGGENGHNSYGMMSGHESGNNENGNEGPEPIYECRHCGKKYRWKSTLRRHENVECGGKEPSHQCPYCPYKSKQRGNLGVHVRKHHSDLPQLASKRRSKYSNKKMDNSNISENVSDDSSHKLVIDCSK